MSRLALALPLLLGPACARPSAASAPEVSTPEVPARTWTRNRFGRPLSTVWRYDATFERADLAPVPNNNPYPEPQPHRDRPEHLALSADGSKVYVTLAGTEAEPGHQVAVVRVATGEVLGRIDVGLRPYVPVLHPGGRFLVVVNELSNYATVIDTTTDQAVGELPLDFGCQGLVFSRDGRRAWVASRYSDQVFALTVQVSDEGLTGGIRELGGFDETRFLGATEPSDRVQAELAVRGLRSPVVDRATGGLNATLRSRCGRCHTRSAGGYVAGPDPLENLLSAVENSVPGRPWESPLIRAVVPQALGGFGDQRLTQEFHPGGALFTADDPELHALVRWIEDAEEGPGMLTGNPGAHPKDLVLSTDERHLFVGNTGTQDVAVLDLTAEHQVGAIHLQNVAAHLALVPDPAGRHDTLVVLTMGTGFGAPVARDPDGGETWERDHAAAQYTLLRDPETTDSLPLADQHVMGPFDAVDGTWNIKMRDIQNDLVAIDLGRLQIPPWQPGMQLDHLLNTGSYEAHPGWVRYTSDTAEATTGDVKGDLPPELMRVPGAIPEWAAVDGDRLLVTMAGSFELVEWAVDPQPADPADRLVPLRVQDTGLRPIGVVATPDHVVVANSMAETLTIFDRATNATREVVVGDLSRPALDTDAEKGELIVHSTVFSSDGDTSCLHCHYRDTGDGRGWGAGETVGQDRQGHLTPGGTLGIPQMRNVYAIQPFYFEGTHRLSEGQGADINEPASSIDFDRPVWRGDYTGVQSPVPASDRRLMHEELKERVEVRQLGDAWYDLEERRDQFIRDQSLRWFGAAYGVRDLYRYVAAWMGAATHLLPNPYDDEAPSVRRGEALFNDATVMCAVCHRPPEFTNKGPLLTHNDRKALPPLITITRRDASYTLASVRAVDRANGLVGLDLEPTDPGRVEDVEGSFTTMQLRGIFDRPPAFLHHGRARSLREVLATPGHPGLRTYRLPVLLGLEVARPGRLEVGLNETTTRTPDGPLDRQDQVPDTHGGTSHLSPRQLDDLVAFLLSIE